MNIRQPKNIDSNALANHGMNSNIQYETNATREEIFLLSPPTCNNSSLYERRITHAGVCNANPKPEMSAHNAMAGHDTDALVIFSVGESESISSTQTSAACAATISIDLLLLLPPESAETLVFFILSHRGICELSNFFVRSSE